MIGMDVFCGIVVVLFQFGDILCIKIAGAARDGSALISIFRAPLTMVDPWTHRCTAPMKDTGMPEAG